MIYTVLSLKESHSLICNQLLTECPQFLLPTLSEASQMELASSPMQIKDELECPTVLYPVLFHPHFFVLEMSPNEKSQHNRVNAGNVEMVIIAEYNLLYLISTYILYRWSVGVLSGLTLSAQTTNAAIREIMARVPDSSILCTPPSSPVSSLSPSNFMSSHSRCDYGQYHGVTSTPSLLTGPAPFTTVPLILASSAPSTPVTKSPSVSSSVATTSSEIAPLDVRHEVSLDILWAISAVGLFKLPTFTLQSKGEKQWQQLYKGFCFDVPGPDVSGPYYLVMKGYQVGVLTIW